MRRRTLTVALIVAAFSWLETSAQQPARDTPARTQAATPSTARITGRVLDAASGRPMKMVIVRLISEVGGRTGQTDEAGVFDFTALPAGRYNVRVQKPGYVGLAYGQRRPLQPGTPLQLDAGQHIKGIEFRMPRGSVVSGTVSDELGEPMPGIAVRLMRFQYAQGVRELVPAGNAQTDDRGIYRIWGLDPGEYYVTAVAPNFNGGGPIPPPGGRGGRGGPALAGRGISPGAPGTPADADVGYAPTYYPGVPSVFEATPVTLGLGAELLDISFNVLLVRTSQITGHVTNTDGTPVTAGNVDLTVEGQVGRRGSGTNFGGRIRWDGLFSIADVPPGRYVIRARGTDDTFPQYGMAPITVAGEDLSDVVVVVTPGATLSGAIVFQGGTPPDPTQVRVVAQAADPTFGATANARVEKDGRFTLSSIPFGETWIRAQTPRGWTLKSVIVDGREVIDTPLDVRTGQKFAGATLVFSDRQTEVNGTLTDTQGRPVTEYTILAFPTDAALWRPQSRQITTARPDQNGRFQIRGLPPGEYFLAAIDPQQQGEWFVAAFLEQQTADASRFTLLEGATRTQDLRFNR